MLLSSKCDTSPHTPFLQLPQSSPTHDLFMYTLTQCPNLMPPPTLATSSDQWGEEGGFCILTGRLYLHYRGILLVQVGWKGIIVPGGSLCLLWCPCARVWDISDCLRWDWCPILPSRRVWLKSWEVLCSSLTWPHTHDEKGQQHVVPSWFPW